MSCVSGLEPLAGKKLAVFGRVPFFRCAIFASMRGPGRLDCGLFSLKYC